MLNAQAAWLSSCFFFYLFFVIIDQNPSEIKFCNPLNGPRRTIEMKKVENYQNDILCFVPQKILAGFK